MRNISKKFKLWGVLLLLTLFTAGLTTYAGGREVQAATKTGFQKIGGKTYYINKNGTKHKGWLTLNGKKYYFKTTTGVQVKGWAKNSKGQKRYFSKKAGVMATGWMKNSKGEHRYFDKSTGVMKTGWVTMSGKKYYFSKSTGIAYEGRFAKDTKGVTRYFYKNSCYMATGWVTTSKKQKRYFDPSTGAMYTGFKKINGNTYYFFKGTGYMAKGWVKSSSSSRKYYFDPSTGVMATGSVTIDGVRYSFRSNGVLIGEDSTQPPTTVSDGKRTIKNYLAGALMPVGQALYVWGGGWNDSTRKGVSPTWKEWYNSQTSSYDYNYYRDLSVANRAKGLDCSGFVGWAAYQVMQAKSNIGSGYTVVAEDVGSYYKSLGWGSIVTQAYLAKTNYTVKPGDVGYNSGHTWIVLGQCSDKSAVIIHSTPQAGCQISGTPTPSGNYSSQAIALAKKYMSKYSGYTKYDYHTSSGNYIRNGNFLRWNRETLTDPDGYMNMTADQILADLFK